MLHCARLPPWLSDQVAFSNPESDVVEEFQDLFVCVEVLRPSQPNGVMSSLVSLPNHTFTGQA